MCTLAGYNKATKTCYRSIDDPQDALDTPDEMAGVFFYETQPTGTAYTLSKFSYDLKSLYLKYTCAFLYH